MGKSMRQVPHQGMALSASQRRAQEFRNQARKAFLNPVLEQQFKETMEAVSKLETRKPIKQWSVERNEQGTICAMDCVFGFEQYQPCTPVGYFDHLGNFYEERE